MRRCVIPRDTVRILLLELREIRYHVASLELFLQELPHGKRGSLRANSTHQGMILNAIDDSSLSFGVHFMETQLLGSRFASGFRPSASPVRILLLLLNFHHEVLIRTQQLVLRQLRQVLVHRTERSQPFNQREDLRLPVLPRLLQPVPRDFA
ncbi:hypothetical protein MPSEU_000922300 [Mayamaea pseudoterrestris]|nr:hypothetical protein MPSEU_000212500 [Mayamaea pseudoterrestris]GKY99683.1 hypothetical protein MPSEU_000922300 [Mayamaea pseudoterrestris]